MKLPDQGGFESSDAHENARSEEPDSGLGPGPGLDGPSGIDIGESQVSKDPLLFIQLNELLGWPQALEWRETGRWLLFEEKLDMGAGRWSAPHVPTLALPSLQNLRSLLAEGIVLLDCQAQSLLELVEQVVSGESLSPELRGQLQALLLQRPQHHIQTPGIRPCRESSAFRKASRDEDAPLKHQNPLRQKLPAGAEAAAVLAGELGFLEQPLGAFVRLRNPVVLEPLTEVILPSRFFCLLLGPPTLGRSYHEMGRAAAVLLSDPQFQWSVRRASHLRDLLAALDAFLQEVTALPPGRWDRTARIPPPKHLPSQHKRLPSKLQEVTSLSRQSAALTEDKRHHGPHTPIPELQRTGRLFGGLIQDVRRKACWYPSDFLDALHPQCFSAVFYIYLATVTNAITFGGLLGDATEGAQGVLESFLGTGVAGAAFCLMAGQPLTILSSTGPVLVFERLLFSFSRDYSLDYLPFRLWVGLWVAAFCLALVATEASLLVRYFTRFTEEGFCALISLIFIYDAVGKMLNLIRAYPIQRPGSSAYGCFCQYLGTGGNKSEWTSTKLKDTEDVLSMPGLANASFLPPSECIRQGGHPRGPSCHTVPDIAFFSLLLFFTSFLCAIALKHVKNSRFFPSVVRKVLGDFSSVLAILLGCGLDAFLGLATPKLLVPTEFKVRAGQNEGARRKWGQQLGVVIRFIVPILEQRLTGLVVFILTGVSIFLAPVLKFIPMPVLYGIFLYMGVAALSSIQFMKRVQLLLMPRKHQPDTLLLRHVPLSRVHLFTAIQLACLGLLWVIKSTPAAIVFPLMLLGLVAVRKALEWVFSPQELLWLDELMPEEEKNVPETRPEPEHLFSGNDSEDSELMYQPKAPEINISVN
ncbi:anion exchange protein 4 [Mus pahari]|uniref:anion exchange protein 4 n=1 Tax=Mus pahari TaxID=10093 RepID=UPI0011149FFA|nr:anion exchange protein 4 [Mus pahari]